MAEQLLRIEEELGPVSEYRGENVFFNLKWLTSKFLSDKITS